MRLALSLLLLAAAVFPGLAKAENALDKEQADYEARRAAEDEEDRKRQDDGLDVKQRDSWFIGFGVLPVGSLKLNGDETPDDMDFRGFNIVAGGTLSPNLLLGGEILSAAVSHTERVGGDDITYTIDASHFGPTIIYFPLVKGPYIKASLYSATLAFTIEVEDEERIGTSDSGYGIGFGGGYAFWIGETFNLNIEANVGVDRFNGDEADQATYSAIGLGFYWY